MTTLKNLEPAIVWQYFEEICKVPRPSTKEDKIIKYLIEFAEKNKFEYAKDDAGNIIIRKPATKGMEKSKPVVLQSHMDMVCEKNSDVKFDFDNDPIQAVVDNGWVRANGTTLGADDGIGMAAQMAILVSEEVKHGPLECLFTVDEESGLTGAFELKPGFIHGNVLLNLDSEDEGELFIGCAGGIDTVAKLKYKHRFTPSKSQAFKVNVKGLKGGHSGDDIDKMRGNSNKILNRFLWNAEKHFKIRLSVFDGGNLRNAIPREAFAIFTVPAKKVEGLKTYFDEFANEIKQEWATSEPELSLSIEQTEMPQKVINRKAQTMLLNSLYACPHGVIAMSQAIPGLVETSTNLASVKFDGKKEISITTSQRSSVDSAKFDIAHMVESVFKIAGCKVEHSTGYPGWAPNTDSEILKITRDSYKRLFNTEPKVRAIHAGLECGLFLEKYPKMDMVSFGPTLRGVHSPEEKIDIETVKKFWLLLLDVLANIPKN